VDEDCELESASAVLGFKLGGAVATNISMISNRASEAATTDHAVRPISAVLRVCRFLSMTNMTMLAWASPKGKRIVRELTSPLE
jgi:hypothetical protein